METRQKIALGTGAGMIWAAGVLWGGAQLSLPIFALVPTVLSAFFAPGLVCLALVSVLAVRRLNGQAEAERASFPDGSAGAGDEKVLRDTLEQMVLALAIWPGAAVMLGANGPGVIAVLGGGFALARIAFWIGVRMSPPLRAFGFAATFCPTLLVAGWALVELVF